MSVHLNDYGPAYAEQVLRTNFGRVRGKRSVATLALPGGFQLRLYRVTATSLVWTVRYGQQEVAAGCLDASDDEVRTVNAGVAPGVQGRGVYPAVLRALASEVGTLVSPPILSAGAVKAWERAGAVVKDGRFVLQEAA